MERIFVFIFVCSFVRIPTDAYEVRDCGSDLGKFVDVAVSTCKATDPVCKIFRGKNATLNIDFVPHLYTPYTRGSHDLVPPKLHLQKVVDRHLYIEKNDSSIKAIAHGKYSGIEVSWPLNQPDACKNSGLVCPLQPGKAYRYIVTFPILKSFPPINLDVKWELQDEKLSDDIVCIEFPVKIV